MTSNNRRARSRYALGIVASLAALAGGAVTAQAGTTTPADSGAGDQCVDQTPGPVSIGTPSVATTLDPYSASGGLGGELSAIYDVLVTYDATTGDFVPRLAESVTPNEDSSVWTLVLRPGITFGNGNPLDAAAVKASIDRHLAEGSTSVLNSYAALIAEINVVDDLTAEFVLTGPWGAFPFSLTRGLGYIVDVSVIDERGAEAFATDPSGAGAGPFEVERWAPPEEVVFKAKDDWWGGHLCVSELTYLVIPDANAANDAFQNGELDAALIDARSPIASAEAKATAPNVATMIQHGGGVVLFNVARGTEPPATADPRVRLAIASAIDPEVINQRAFDGVGYPQKGLISDASQAYQATEGPAYDPELAASLVEEVKAETGWDGTLRFDCVSNLEEAAITMEAMLEAVGFVVNLDSSHSLPQQIGIVLDGNFDLACFGHTPDEADLWDGLRGYESTNPRNFTGFNSPDMDAALNNLRGATGTEAIQAAMEDVQAVWNETNPAVIYAAFEHVLVWNDSLHGLDFNYSTTVVAMFDHAWIDS